MDKIMKISTEYDIRVVEDAAQAIMSKYKGAFLGTIGHIGTLSFHETKNIISGEGGALLLRDDELLRNAEIVREKGTDRSQFFRGEVDKYTWKSIGSSFLPSEITAADLLAQLEEAQAITSQRLEIWNRYHDLLEPLELEGLVRRPVIPRGCEQNGHMYFVILTPGQDRSKILHYLRDHGINAVSHYVPLHSSPAGIKFGRVHNTMTNTDFASANIIRLPMWLGLKEQDQIEVVTTLHQALLKKR
jgi:dTDP-4-amino-4,6-dideoxygalactose transaminase